MAKNESNASLQPREAATQPTKYDFQAERFSRPEADHANLPGATVQRFADTVEAVSNGAASILRLIDWDKQREESHEHDSDAHPAPFLNEYHRDVLLRLVATNMDMLVDEAAQLKSWAYRQHTPEGKTEQLAEAMRLVQRHERMSQGVRA